MKGRISMVPLELGLVAMGMEGATGREKKHRYRRTGGVCHLSISRIFVALNRWIECPVMAVFL